MLKIVFFCLKSDINEKISEEFFCFLFFLVAHMFLKTNSIVRKNGIFNSLWGGIQRCVQQLFIHSSTHWLGRPLITWNLVEAFRTKIVTKCRWNWPRQKMRFTSRSSGNIERRKDQSKSWDGSSQENIRRDHLANNCFIDIKFTYR